VGASSGQGGVRVSSSTVGSTCSEVPECHVPAATARGPLAAPRLPTVQRCPTATRELSSVSRVSTPPR
jgi:hypothetical protein